MGFAHCRHSSGYIRESEIPVVGLVWKTLGTYYKYNC